ncbi:MAG TPA: valine--tRNA ligase [Candidatus Saccharimonadia bacterium]|nr:valine--tRNA ligase [Candidatus Saccharimonadia bacterium]
MSLPKNYQPNLFEDNIYKIWQDNAVFKPKANAKQYFSMVLPPPNANAKLHLGQALTVAIEDISVRYNRMKGLNTLYIPGADHAGFETWVVYEKKLNKEGKTRFDFTNRELYKLVWDFVADNRKNLLEQLKSVGISADWDKFTFSLDDKVINQAYKTFKKMWDGGLIYRGERLVNYCTYHGTSFSDIEVVYKNQEGKIWYINYPISQEKKYITIATTRPETMLGDTAVAVNPNDKRYKEFIGKEVILPLTNRKIPILADKMVDPTFGTGAVKITPAHDINDYDLAQRHKLPMISVINKKGRMEEVPKQFLDLTVDDARREVIRELKELDLLVKEEPHSNRVGHCYKCHTVIQPLLSDQWFVKMQPLAENAIKHLENNEVKFLPKTKLKQSIEYLKNLRDWNISRQIAWGIPIPAFQNQDNPDDWIFDKRVDKDEIRLNGSIYKRDNDVFDTWFSSSQWPYVVLDYPNSKDFKKFYPLTLMETGGEILYQWVCRMLMLGLYVTGKTPFKNVYIHGYVLTTDGSKMSKSIGNVIDPVPLIQKYGSDALRIGLIVDRAPGVNKGFDYRKVEEGRNFANKIWNIARFIESKLDKDFVFSFEPIPKFSQDYWILDRLASVVKSVSKNLDSYKYSEAFDNIYRFVWNDFADWYIEASKTDFNPGVLTFCFDAILRLIHPFAPFVSETIYKTFDWHNGEILASSSWPIKIPTAKNKDEFGLVIDLVTEIRFIKGMIKKDSKFSLEFTDKNLNQYSNLIANLAKLNNSKLVKKGSGMELQSAKDTFLNLPKSDISQYLREINTQIKDKIDLIKHLNGRLENKSYLQGAPKEVIEDTKLSLNQAKFDLKFLIEQKGKN